MLSLGTLSCPSAYSEPWIQKPREQKEAPAARGSRIFEYCDTSASQPLMSLGVIMLTWTWNKTTKQIYSEVDLWAREFSALTFTCTKSHGQSLVKKTFVLHFSCILLLWNLYFTFSKTQPLITKCHNKWLHIISNINYHCAPYSFMKQSMRVESFFFFFPHQDPINSMQLPNSWWHFDSKSSLLSSVSIIKIRCCNHLSLQ